ELLKELAEDESYPALFFNAFGSSDIDSEVLAKALEQFLLSIVSQDSKFDQAARGEVTLTDQEKHGLKLFVTEFDPDRNLRGADCFHCHGGNLFTNNRFSNNGLPQSPVADLGLFTATGKPGDKGKFKTPSLRNIELTGPYMHDGRFGTLEEVIDHYSSGVQRSKTLDPNLAKHPIQGIQLTEEEKSALVAFLKTLTDQQFK
ncbi:MAG: cytochrome c peroxidase, partial [Verrucomicrobiota bacterium]